MIKQFYECNRDFNEVSFGGKQFHNPNKKGEEFKECDEQRSLLHGLRTFKTIQYAFEVDGQ